MQKEEWFAIVYQDDRGDLFSTTSREYRPNAFADVVEFFRGDKIKITELARDYITKNQANFNTHPLSESQIAELTS